MTLTLLGVAMVSGPGFATPAGVLVYGAVLGTMQGMAEAIQSSVYAHYFGRAHVGQIKGFASAVGVAGASLGPFLLAIGFEMSGAYAPSLLIAALIPFLIAAVTPFLRLSRDGSLL